MGMIYVNENLAGANNADKAASSSVNSLFGRAKVRDGYPGSLFKFNAAAADDYVSFDLNVPSNSDFETWTLATLPDDWTDDSTGTGALSEGTATPSPNTGSSYLEMAGNGSSNIAIATQDIELVSGLQYRINASAYGNGVGATMVQFFIKETGQYITPAGALQTTQDNYVEQTTAAWATSTNIVTMPTFAVSLKHKVTVEIKCYTEAAAGYVDTIEVFPVVNFCSIHGHNLANSNIVPTLTADTVSGFGTPTSIGTMTIERPSFYKTFSENGERYFKIAFIGTHFEPIELGEVVVGYYSTLARFYNVGAKTMFKLPQKVNTSFGLQRQVLNLADDPIRTLALSFLGLTAAQMEEVRDEMILRTGYGRTPLIVVPDTAKDLVVHGRYVKDNWDYIQKNTQDNETFGYQLQIIEDPFAVSIS